MENLCIFVFFFLFLSLSAIAQPPPPVPAMLTPPPQQLRNIIDALIGAGDFTSWVTILSLANPLMLPMSATLFVPQDGSDLISDNHPAMDPLLFPYHIVPQRLSFSDLLLFKPNTRLPTLLPAMSLVITNSSRFNFTLNNIPVTHPNLYNTDSISVHGIAAVLDYSIFGYSFPLLPTPTTETTAGNQESEVLPSPPSPPEGILTPPFMAIGDPSDAACSCTEAPIVFLIFCAVLAFKMQRIPFIR
ncbi:FAS1 domain-containing protein SELMODRAFT_448915-like [Neltuma alba]|uniref:FAS1 domain-containing protein SELMODRAFT_448915-like n=1 Tax=Neltuma alba TaxID=207710 RepID=UPI0010A44CEE|nr:FAS1 domain-containing protein SELMODRAFT_448915-like [Prosopis alba]